jgi:uncharacterized protein YggE
MNSIKPWVLQILAVLLGIFLLLVVVDKFYQVMQDFRPSTSKNTISMTAQGQVTATPDLATVNIGVSSTGTTAKQVQDDMTSKVNQITDFVKQQGINPKDITTSNFSVYASPTFYPPVGIGGGGITKSSGYQGNESITVKVHGVDQSTDTLSKILGGAVTNGSNEIQGVNFSFSDPDNQKQQARTQAIDKAKQKAQELADETGLKLGRVVSVADNDNSYPVPLPFALNSGSGVSAPASVAPNVEPGSQDVTASVTVVFEVK